MSNKKNKQAPSDDEMQAEYDLSNREGERGRYYDALQQGYTVRIHEDDGTTTVQHYKLEEGAVLLDPDVREYFPDAKAVNTALRALIALIPDQPVRRRRNSGAATGSQR
jgi:hypothetical protein